MLCTCSILAAACIKPAAGYKMAATSLFDSADQPMTDAVEDIAVDNTSDRFSAIVSALEEVILKDDFEDQAEGFFRAHCHSFEDAAENKLLYTDLFERYTGLIEGMIMAHLSTAVENFRPEELADLLTTHSDDLVGEVFDVLLSLSDFENFKHTMVAWKEQVQWERAQVLNQSSASGGAGTGSQNAASQGLRSPLDLSDLKPVVTSLSSSS